MPITAKETRKEFAQAPEGLHQAVCVDVVDLGMVQGQWGEKHKVRLIWQIEETNPETKHRFEIRSDYGLTLSEKSRLRPMLEAWRGRKFTKEELEGFDLERLLGVNCQVQVVHNITDEGRIYANVQAIVPPAKGMLKLSPQEYVRHKDRAKAQGNAEKTEAGDDEIPF